MQTTQQPNLSHISPTILNDAELNPSNMVNFLELPGEIRNLIYDHLLVFEEPIVPWATEEALPVNLLYTNKAVHHEFGSLFYSRITFDFSTNGHDYDERPCSGCLTKQITSFLDQIGDNARHIQSLKIDFPYIEREETESWVNCWISGYSVEVVKQISSNCPDLKKMILGPHLTLYDLLDLAVVDPDEAFELLIIVDAFLRTNVPSVNSISVRVPDSEEFLELMIEMEDFFRWHVEMIYWDEFEWMGDDDDEEEDDDDDDEHEEEDDDENEADGDADHYGA
ncbi:hypothetical protein EIK77_006984 [Talaromyces pinophilus]|nr:hypothetical protein EIK77_006984 [Talaromyces pinophilus]PCG91288.1 Hypothetical protein PENO1_094580 [Penicillium occitanis (nom. inval.)]PCG91668.1 hypothetical protein PENOC_096300 [Penicillium occitanis (nom. inval.)]